METLTKNEQVVKSPLGLNLEYSTLLTERLNQLLASFQVFYMNVRGFHWNIKGPNFFELHAKFEELYDDLQIKIDELAERVLTLGKQPMHTYREYLSASEVQVVSKVSDGRVAVENLLKALNILLKQERELLTLSDEAGDEGTNSLMSDYIREQEKLAWMYRAYLS